MLANTSDLPKTRQWTTQERVWCVQKFLETKSFVKTQQNFLHRFGTELAPTKSALFNMVEKFQYTGTVKNLNKKCKTEKLILEERPPHVPCYCYGHTLGNDVFYNSTPNSPFCFRPVTLIALKEEYSSVKLIMNTIVNPQTDHIIQDGLSHIGGHAQVEIVRSFLIPRWQDCWMELVGFLVICVLQRIAKLKV
ncbi:hypothetical protein LOD99_15592 [Oopsacas minuta]|uniref:DUF4817 domain-containing protein n=1 Tax=Oopsacas minuta TaxID=111878 RepID=A0AAV7KAS4_9METZ|nr:hypothetical protein LOD99_15592 [Oopsacas minuta]